MKKADRSSAPRESHVLVVDDEPDIRFLARIVLQQADYLIVEAESGEEAMAVLAAQQDDIVLLDLRMPGLDGWGVLEAMKAKHLLEQLPVLMVSAHADPAMARRAVEEGCSGFLSKPFRPAALLKVVRTTLGDL